MTPKEALEVFLHPFRGMATGKQIAEAEQVVITALDELEILKEKATPKHTIEDRDGNYCCPVCDTEIEWSEGLRGHWDYCPGCGQRFER
jgi:hypothetical protein